MIIAFVNQKGGVGKTTLALHVSHQLAAHGERVTLIDADPQGSALEWAKTRTRNEYERRFAVISLARDTLHLEVPDIARCTDHVVIDAPPRATALTRCAVIAAERVLIPLQPSPFDLWASDEIVAMVKEAQMFKPRLQAAFIANRVVTGAIVARALSSTLSRAALPKLSSEVGQRVAFAESARSGRLASELEPHGRAAAEIEHLVQEIREIQ
jgi:chromosome partitioning protein